MPTASEQLMHALIAHGVTTVFGIPGVDNLGLFDAIDRSDCRCVLVRHEASGAYAADAFARVSGTPAVCVTTAGPGAANTVAAMGEAWASMSPLLHITTTVALADAEGSRPRGLPHYHPRQRSIFEPVSKLALRCDDPNRLAETAVTCLEAACRPPQGPAYLEVPHDLLSAPVSEGPSGDPLTANRTKERSKSIDLEWPAFRAAADLLNASARPIIWAGSGVLGAEVELLQVADELDAPVLLTHSAKRRFRGLEHDLVVTEPPHEPAIAGLVEGADAALVVGSDLDALMTRGFDLVLPAALIHIDVDPRMIGMSYPAEVEIVAPSDRALQGLVPLIRHKDRGARERVAHARRRTREELAASYPTPVRLLEALDQSVPEDGIIVCDMAVAGYWAAGLLPLAPKRQLLYPAGWGTLGFSLPAALGAALVDPERRTICVCGDSGLMYAVGELATAVEQRLPLTIVVVNDAGYGMLRFAARQRFGRTFAVDLATPNLVELSKAFGIPAWSADLSDALLDILKEAMQGPGPTLLEIRGELTPPRMALLYEQGEK